MNNGNVSEVNQVQPTKITQYYNTTKSVPCITDSNFKASQQPKTEWARVVS
jgi:subtilase family serine protease